MITKKRPRRSGLVWGAHAARVLAMAPRQLPAVDALRRGAASPSRTASRSGRVRLPEKILQPTRRYAGEFVAPAAGGAFGGATAAAGAGFFLAAASASFASTSTASTGWIS